MKVVGVRWHGIFYGMHIDNGLLECDRAVKVTTALELDVEVLMYLE